MSHFLVTNFWSQEVGLLSAWIWVPLLLCYLLLGRQWSVLRNMVIVAAVAYFMAAAAWVTDMLGYASMTLALLESARLICGLVAIRGIGLLIVRWLLPKLSLTPSGIVGDLLMVVAYFAWSISRMHAAGFQPSSILTTSAVATGVLVFSLQETLGNILGGLVLQFDDSLQMGDWLRLDDVVGKVVQVHWRYTAVITNNGERVVIPNSQLMKSKFTVIGIPQEEGVATRRQVTIYGPLDVAPGRFIELIDKTLASAEIPFMTLSPAPSCILLEVANGYLIYQIRYWLLDMVYDGPTDSLVRQFALAAMFRNGIAFPLAQQRVQFEELSTAQREAARSEELLQKQKVLASVELFASLREDELQHLARHLISAPFAKGEVITRQGAEAHWLYILQDGEAKVWVTTANGEERLVNTLHAGDFFGERALLTGAPRSATVKADSPALCYRLDKPAFASVISSRPEIAGEISTILAKRARELDEIAHGEGSRAVAEQRLSERLRESIRHFFGLTD